MHWFRSWFQRDEIYEALPPAEKDEDGNSPPGSTTPWTRRVSVIRDRVSPALFGAAIFGIGLLFSAGLLIGLLAGQPPRLPYPDVHAALVQEEFRIAKPWNASNPSPCGHTIESAKAAGCRWSPMIWAWFPPACYDWELEEKFLAEQDWEWFATRDLAPESRLPREAILRGDEPEVFVTARYHKMHCAYAFRKLFRSVLGVTLGDNYLLTSGHMHHCDGNMITDGWGTTAGVAKWLDCVVL